MSNLKTQIKHSNICDIALKRIRKYCGKKKRNYKRRKQRYKAFFEGETGIFIIEELARDIIERCKLPEAIEFRNSRKKKQKKKHFPRKDIVLNKKFNNRKPDIWFKNHNLIIEVDEGNHENYDSDGAKEKEDTFKKNSFKIFQYNPNDPNFDLHKLLGKTNLLISTLR